MGLAGQAPGLLGLLTADLAVGAVAGATAVLSFGTLVPHLASALGARGGRAVVAALLLASVGVAGWASVQLARPFRCGLGWLGLVRGRLVEWSGWPHIGDTLALLGRLYLKLLHLKLQPACHLLCWQPVCLLSKCFSAAHHAATTTPSACWCSTSTSRGQVRT